MLICMQQLKSATQQAMPYRCAAGYIKIIFALLKKYFISHAQQFYLLLLSDELNRWQFRDRYNSR